MNNNAKTSIIFVILLLLISLGTAGFYFISYENEKTTTKELRGQLDIIKEEKSRLNNQLIQITNEKIALDNKVKENNELIAKLNDKLTQEIEAKKLLLKEQESLQDKILDIEQERKNIQAVLNEKTQELAKLQSQLKTTISEKEKIEERIKTSSLPVESAVSLDKIVVTPSSATKSEQNIKVGTSSVSSSVLLINREYSFLVLNVGKRNNIEVGDVFEIFHDGVSLGRVQVEKTHDTMSAANFSEGFKIEQAREGDTANKID